MYIVPCTLRVNQQFPNWFSGKSLYQLSSKRNFQIFCKRVWQPSLTEFQGDVQNRKWQMKQRNNVELQWQCGLRYSGYECNVDQLSLVYWQYLNNYVEVRHYNHGQKKKKYWQIHVKILSNFRHNYCICHTFSAPPTFFVSLDTDLEYCWVLFYIVPSYRQANKLKSVGIISKTMTMTMTMQ